MAFDGTDPSLFRSGDLVRYSTAANGPGILVIFDMPDPNVAPALSGVVVASGALQNVELKRLWTPEEITPVRQTASKLRSAYKLPGK